MLTYRPSSSDLGTRVSQLNEALERVAEANAHAAELVVDLELTRARLEDQNRALEQAKLAAEESARLKSVFLATMSHELRTPLNAIIGYSEMLREDASALGLEQMDADLERIHVSAKHLLGLINDVLDFSKIEAGKLPVRTETVPVAPALRKVSETVMPLIRKNGNSISTECPENLTALADPMRLTQCLLNLASNAAKFTSAGTVAIAASREEHFVRIDVRDTGIGVDPSFLAHLFEPFRQAGSSEIRTESGTGLGLAISRKLARLMGGDVTAESRPGEGATFTLRLPVAS
ncbi:MAG: ATP-binding protein [Bryobacteraceae bacterium]